MRSVFATNFASRPVVVLGMHKSGTTLIAETLHRSGIPMIGTELDAGYDDGNKMERDETRALNMELLGDNGRQSLRVIQPLAPGNVTSAQRDQARAVIDAVGLDVWGFKDPRTLLTFGFWQDVLEDPILVGIFRNPVEVFGHYLRRAGRRWISRDPTFLPDALRAWCVYNNHLLDLKRKHPQMLLLEYAEFMTSELGLQRMAIHLGRPLADCRQPAMRRAVAIPTTDYRLAKLVVRLRDRLNPDQIYNQLKDASADPFDARTATRSVS